MESGYETTRALFMVSLFWYWTWGQAVRQKPLRVRI